jgi:hypothetical protein
MPLAPRCAKSTVLQESNPIPLGIRFNQLWATKTIVDKVIKMKALFGSSEKALTLIYGHFYTQF